ncbi:WD repeat-containing protein, putative [Plasmodium vinckei vinckei]|uniref:WD repeat-containing protein, putative n=1 Tax=Plasmodium vinckei vinckei TaxID=54757 RepID=A0A449BWC4_PLAVN|nr:WD repeat-containing protein, putative [Plasmodium vinckei vinckei]VEV57776.1 WD repeat-containing protein, putative [Plasmodium vinckei vinckei]
MDIKKENNNKESDSSLNYHKKQKWNNSEDRQTKYNNKKLNGHIENGIINKNDKTNKNYSSSDENQPDELGKGSIFGAYDNNRSKMKKNKSIHHKDLSYVTDQISDNVSDTYKVLIDICLNEIRKKKDKNLDEESMNRSGMIKNSDHYKKNSYTTHANGNDMEDDFFFNLENFKSSSHKENYISINKKHPLNNDYLFNNSGRFKKIRSEPPDINISNKIDKHGDNFVFENDEENKENEFSSSRNGAYMGSPTKFDPNLIYHKNYLSLNAHGMNHNKELIDKNGNYSTGNHSFDEPWGNKDTYNQDNYNLEIRNSKKIASDLNKETSIISVGSRIDEIEDVEDYDETMKDKTYKGYNQRNILDVSPRNDIENDMFNIFKNVINMLTYKYPEHDIKRFFFNSQNRLKNEYENNKDMSIKLTSYECNKYNNIYSLVKQRLYYTKNDIKNRNDVLNCQYKYDIYNNHCVKNIQRNVTILSHFLPHTKNRNFITQIKFDQYSENILTSGIDGFIKIYHVNTGNLISCIRAHNYAITDFDIHRSNKYIISCDEKGIVKLTSVDKYKSKNLLTYRRTFSMKNVFFFYNDIESSIGRSTGFKYKTYALCSTNSYFFIIHFDDLNNDMQIIKWLDVMPLKNYKFSFNLHFSYSLNYNIAPYVYENLIISKNPIKELKNSYLIFINTKNNCLDDFKDTEFGSSSYNKTGKFNLSGTNTMGRLSNFSMNSMKRKKKLTFILLTTKIIYDCNEENDRMLSITPDNIVITKYINKTDNNLNNSGNGDDVIEVSYKGEKKKNNNDEDIAYKKIHQNFEINILENVKNNVGSILFKKFEDFNDEIVMFAFSNTSSNFVTTHINGAIYFWNLREYLTNITKKEIRGRKRIPVCCFYTSLYVEFVLESSAINETNKAKNNKNENANNNKSNNNNGTTNKNKETENNNLFVISSTSCSSYCYSSSDMDNTSKKDSKNSKMKKKKNKTSTSNNPNTTNAASLNSIYISENNNVPNLGDSSTIMVGSTNAKTGNNNKKGKNTTKDDATNSLGNEKSNTKPKLRAKKLHYKISNINFNVSDEYIIVADGITNKSNSTKEMINAVTMKTNISIFSLLDFEEIKYFDLKKCDSYISFIEPNPNYKDIVLFGCFRKYIYLLNLEKKKIIKKYSYDSELKNLRAQWNKNGYTFIVSHNYGYFSIFTLNNNYSYKLTLTEQLTSSQICYLSENNNNNNNERVDDFDNLNLLPEFFLFDSYYPNNQYGRNGNSNSYDLRDYDNIIDITNNVDSGFNIGSLIGTNSNNVIPLIQNNQTYNTRSGRSATSSNRNRKNNNEENNYNIINDNSSPELIHTRSKNGKKNRRIIEDSSDSSKKSNNTIYTLYSDSNSRCSGKNSNNSLFSNKKSKKKKKASSNSNDDIKIIDKKRSRPNKSHIINLENMSDDGNEVITVEDVYSEGDQENYKENGKRVKKNEIINIDNEMDSNNYIASFDNKRKKGKYLLKDNKKNNKKISNENDDDAFLIEDNECIQINDNNIVYVNNSYESVLDDSKKFENNEKIKKLNTFFILKSDNIKSSKHKKEDNHSFSDCDSYFDQYSSISFLSDESDYYNYSNYLDNLKTNSSSNENSSSISDGSSIEAYGTDSSGQYIERSFEENIFGHAKWGSKNIMNRLKKKGKAYKKGNTESITKGDKNGGNKSEYNKKVEIIDENEENRVILNNFNNPNVLVDKKFKIYDHELQPLLPQFTSFNCKNDYFEYLKESNFDSIYVHLNYFNFLRKKLKNNNDFNYKILLLYGIVYDLLLMYGNYLPNFDKRLLNMFFLKACQEKTTNFYKSCEDETETGSYNKRSKEYDKKIVSYKSDKTCSNNSTTVVCNKIEGKNMSTLSRTIGSELFSDPFNNSKGKMSSLFINEDMCNKKNKKEKNFIKKINQYIETYLKKNNKYFNSEKDKKRFMNVIKISKIYKNLKHEENVFYDFYNDDYLKHQNGVNLSIFYQFLKRLPCKDEEDVDSFIYYNKKNYSNKNIKILFKKYLSHYELVDKNKKEYDYKLFIYSNNNTIIYMNDTVKKLLHVLDEKHKKTLVRENYNILNNLSLKGRNCIIKNINNLFTCEYFNPYSVYVRSPMDNYDLVNPRNYNNSFFQNYSGYNDLFNVLRNNIYDANFENIGSTTNRTAPYTNVARTTNRRNNNNRGTSHLFNYDSLAHPNRNAEIAVISEGSSAFTSDQSANYFIEDDYDDDYDDDYEDEYVDEYEDEFEDEYDDDYSNDSNYYGRRSRRTTTRKRRRTHRTARSTTRNNRSRRNTTRSKKKTSRRKKPSRTTENTTIATSSRNLNVRKSDRLKKKEEQSTNTNTNSGITSSRYFRNSSNTSRNRYNTRSSNNNNNTSNNSGSRSFII